MSGAPLLLEVSALSVRAGPLQLLETLSMQVAAGEFIAILGRNGCGKSLTLHTLAGLRAAAAGEVRLGGVALGALKRRAIAQRLGLLPQDREEALGLTTLETVLTGRHPHLKLWQRESAADRALAAHSLERFGVARHAERPLAGLSGGEQRRAAMAALLAQAPHVYLLDEPTNHLDPHHQLEVLQIFRALADAGAAVIATLHDPTLAERFADRVLLMHGDGRWQLGGAAQLLNAEVLSQLYLTPMMELSAPGRRAFIPA
jgi:iron complex transport system ATP-binding protein